MFYNLQDGGWFQITFVSISELFIRVFNRKFKQVTCPLPPKTFLLGTLSFPITFSNDEVPADSMVRHSRQNFKFSLLKKMETSDLIYLVSLL